MLPQQAGAADPCGAQGDGPTPNGLVPELPYSRSEYVLSLRITTLSLRITALPLRMTVLSLRTTVPSVRIIVLSPWFSKFKEMPGPKKKSGNWPGQSFGGPQNHDLYVI